MPTDENKSCFDKLLDALISALPENKLLRFIREHCRQNIKGVNSEWVYSKILSEAKIYEKTSAITQSGQNVELLSKKLDWEYILNNKKEEGDKKGKYTDYRIRQVELYNFRKYPAKPIENKLPFGINFCDKDNNPTSSVIMGTNGIGKSSIYNAIEFVFRSKISEIDFRDYGEIEKKKRDNDAIIKDFIQNWKDTTGNPNVRLLTQTGFFSLSKLFVRSNLFYKPYVQNFFFVSNQEILEMGQMKYENGVKNSFRQVVADAFDLGEIIYFCRMLRMLSLKNDQRFDNEPIDREKLIGEIDTTKTLLSNETELYFSDDRETKLKLFKQNSSKINDFCKNMSDFFFTTEGELTHELFHVFFEKLKSLLQKSDELLNAILKENSEISVDGLFIQLKRNNDSVVGEVQNILVYKNLNFQLFDKIEKLSEDEKIQYKQNFTRIIKILKNTQRSLQDYYNNRLVIIEGYEAMQKSIPSNQKKRADIVNSLIENVEKLYNIKGGITLTEKENYSKIKKDAREIYDLIAEDVACKFKEKYEPIIEPIRDVLKKFSLDEDDIKVEWKHDCRTIDSGNNVCGSYLSIDIFKEGIEKPISPKKYLNTFRYQLFGIMLKIILSFQIKKQLKINVPIVLDDMFYATDFHNRKDIGKLIEVIFETHDAMFEKETDLSDLQLIFFTHDDLVFNAIQRAVMLYNYRTSDKKIPVKFSQLLGYEDAEKCDNNAINNLVFNYD